jgi:hypothetical protein
VIESLEEIKSSLTYESRYAIEHVRITFHTNCSAINAVIDSYLRYFRAGEELNGSAHYDLFLARREAGLIEKLATPFSPRMKRIAGYFGPDQGKISEIEFFQIFEENQRLHFRRGRERPSIWASLELPTHSLSCLIAEDVKERSWGFRQLFLVVLQEIMKNEGLFPIHAAGVSRNGRGILIVAPAGYGKTTTTLLLLRQGFSLLSDDTLFLRERGEELEVISFPEEVKILPETVPLFDELSFLQHTCMPEGSDKFTFPIEKLYRNRIEWRARPEILIFLEKGEDYFPGIRPMEKKTALKSFFSQMSLPGANKGALRSYFEMITKLVRFCRTYSLKSEYDRAAVPDAITSLLQNRLP